MGHSLLPEGECIKTFCVQGERVLSHSLPCMPQGPGGVQVLEEEEDYRQSLLNRPNDVLPSALVLGSGSSVTDGGGAGGEEDRHDDGGVEVHHHSLAG